MRRAITDDSLRCSFCGKAQGVVGKLIASPSHRVPVYICDECIAVCALIIEDDRVEASENAQPFTEDPRHPLLDHPLASQLIEAVENWIHDESLLKDGAAALTRVRALAMQIMQDVAGTPTAARKN